MYSKFSTKRARYYENIVDQVQQASRYPAIRGDGNKFLIYIETVVTIESSERKGREKKRKKSSLLLAKRSRGDSKRIW